MLDSPQDFVGKVTFVVGSGKGCGKTAFLNRAAALARRGLADCGRPYGGGLALLTVGYEGEAREYLSGERRPAVAVEAGDVVVTTERFAAPCSPEILDAFPGSTSLGRLCVSRATRRAAIALAGPEGNELVAWAVGRAVDERWAGTVLVDGAVDRLTQAASVPGARFVYVMGVDRAGLPRAAAVVRRIAALAGLPVSPARTELTTALGTELAPGTELADASNDSDAWIIDGALTAEAAAGIPDAVRSVVVGDMTKVFLGSAELAAFLRRRELSVLRRLEFAGFSVSCRGLSDGEFLDTVGEGPAASLVSFNPYEIAEGAA